MLRWPEGGAWTTRLGALVGGHGQSVVAPAQPPGEGHPESWPRRKRIVGSADRQEVLRDHDRGSPAIEDGPIGRRVKNHHLGPNERVRGGGGFDGLGDPGAGPHADRRLVTLATTRPYVMEAHGSGQGALPVGQGGCQWPLHGMDAAAASRVPGIPGGRVDAATAPAGAAEARTARARAIGRRAAVRGRGRAGRRDTAAWDRRRDRVHDRRRPTRGRRHADRGRRLLTSRVAVGARHVSDGTTGPVPAAPSG